MNGEWSRRGEFERREFRVGGRGSDPSFAPKASQNGVRPLGQKREQADVLRRRPVGITRESN